MYEAHMDQHRDYKDGGKGKDKTYLMRNDVRGKYTNLPKSQSLSCLCAISFTVGRIAEGLEIKMLDWGREPWNVSPVLLDALRRSRLRKCVCRETAGMTSDVEGAFSS
jgi:hypothetical protein